MTTAAKLGSFSSANHRVSRRCSPVFYSNRVGQARFGPLWASEGFDSGPSEIDESLQVVAGRHHRHRKVRSRLADRADQLPAHLFDGRKHMLDPGTRLGDSGVAPLLTLGQRLVALALPLDLVPITLVFQPVFARLGRVAPIRIDVQNRVEPVEHLVEVLAVVGAGRIGLDLADDLVLRVDVDGEFVAEVGLAVFLGPGRVNVLLPAFGRFPVCRHRTVLDPLVLLPAVTLLGRRHQGGVDDLAAASNEAPREQLCRHTVEEYLRARLPNPILKRPDGGAVGNVRCRGQTAEALVAHAIEQLILHLLVGQVVQALQDQDAHHRLGRVRRAAALRTHRARRRSDRSRPPAPQSRCATRSRPADRPASRSSCGDDQRRTGRS